MWRLSIYNLSTPETKPKIKYQSTQSFPNPILRDITTKETVGAIRLYDI